MQALLKILNWTFERTRNLNFPRFFQMGGIHGTFGRQKTVHQKPERAILKKIERIFSFSSFSRFFVVVEKMQKINFIGFLSFKNLSDSFFKHF